MSGRAGRPLATPPAPAPPPSSAGFAERAIAAIREATAPDPAPLIGVWRRASSTNDLARAAAGDAAAVRTDGFSRLLGVFLAEEQTAGRGRWGRRWVSPPGGLYLSLLAAPRGASARERLGNLALLPIVAGLAAAWAVRRSAGAPAALRWPNDLDLDGRKIAGVLTETGFVPNRPELAAIGFGINCGPVALAAAGPDADAEAPDRPPGRVPEGTDRARLAGALVAAFRAAASLQADDPAELRTRWESLSPSSRGCRCRVRLGNGAGGREVWIGGRTGGLDPGGGLRVALDGGGQRVIHASDALRVLHGALHRAPAGEPGGRG